jgi:pimeloyl-ACP methyl ester carboxylesterase
LQIKSVRTEHVEIGYEEHGDAAAAAGGQIAALAQDVLDLADALGLDRFVLAGHDWGSRAAQGVAVLAPHWRFEEAEFAAAATAWDNEQFVDTVVHYYRHRWGNAPDSPLYARQQALLAAIPPFGVPATMVVGTTDAVNLPAASRGTDRHFAAGLRWVAAEGAGHFIQREQPGLVAAVIRDQISRISQLA